MSLLSPQLWRRLRGAAAIGVGLCLLAGEAHAQCEWQSIQGFSPNTYEDFGRFVAVRSGLLVAGAPVYEYLEGTARVFRRTHGGWALQAVLSSGEVANLNTFGRGAAMDDERLVVGDNHAAGDGAAYVYRAENGQFALEQKIPGFGGFFGRTVAILGDVILVGAAIQPPYGGAYVYRRLSGTWTFEQELTMPMPNVADYFGSDVAIAGDVAVVGAIGVNGSHSFTGAAFVYRHVRGHWEFEQKLAPTDSATGQKNFGASVALSESGATLAVGAERTAGNKGAVHLYAYDGQGWVLTQILVPAAAAGAARFGCDLALSEDGKTLVVGAYADYSVATAAGAAYIYKLVDGIWQQVYQFARIDGACVGASVAIHGDIVVVGDPCHAGFNGRVHVVAGAQPIDCNGNGIADGCDIASGFSQDLDQDGIPDECAPAPVSPDLNGDGMVDGADLGVLLGAWGECPPAAGRSPCLGDLDGDGVIDGADLGALLVAWGVVDPAAGCTAEPKASCCAARAGPGCDDGPCCNAICATDPFCCESCWDAICVNAAQAACGCPPPAGCGEPEGNDCCLTGASTPGVPGCNDALCCEFVCDYFDPSCCEIAWDASCATWASQFCGFCRPVSCGQSTNDCCAFNFELEPGCTDLACCLLVCSVDPYCCNHNWEPSCTFKAQNLCAVCEGTPPP
ncbi:MAG TPA: hypothetical protein PKC43_01375 [Phycisphaerales bacterium]|nr:hypothetical protein [Phycisphaerales bacterium]HMP36076.1 hypothetical protein [Phycisphaerales bacterium]